VNRISNSYCAAVNNICLCYLLLQNLALFPNFEIPIAQELRRLKVAEDEIKVTYG